MKKFLLLLILSVIFGLSSTVGATTIVDNYYGKDDNGLGDVIGLESKFGISKMEVDQSGTTLTVDIYSKYLDNIDALTTTLTDLFISTDGWNPITTAPNYLDDWSSNGERWEYALVMDNYLPAVSPITDASGEVYLYDDLYNPQKGVIKDSEDSFLAGGTIRNGQEVQYDPTIAPNDQNPTWLAKGTWDILFNGTTDDSDDVIRFVVDYDLGATDPLAFHYASANCANEVIEGQVPEPATILLSGLGLLGMGCFLRRKLKKA